MFSYQDPLDEGGRLIIAEYTELVFENDDGSLQIPTSESDQTIDRLRTLNDLRQFLLDSSESRSSLEMSAVQFSR